MRQRLIAKRGIAPSGSTSQCELIDSTDEAPAASIASGRVVSMSGVVLTFPERRDHAGARWEPWVDERVIARLRGESADSATLARRGHAVEVAWRLPQVQDLAG